MTLRTKKLLARLAHAAAREIKVIYTHEPSCYNSEIKTIKICVDGDEDCGFMRHLREVHGVKWANTIHEHIWTVLHEIGHYYTYSKYENNEHEYNIRMKFEELSFDTVNRSPKLQNIYYNMKSEYVATKYAVDFIKRHYKLMKKLSVLLSEDE